MQAIDSCTTRPVSGSSSVGTIPYLFALSSSGDFQWYHQSVRSVAAHGNEAVAVVAVVAVVLWRGVAW